MVRLKAVRRPTLQTLAGKLCRRVGPDEGVPLAVAELAYPLAPSYQLRPDLERYQQIQQALADKGYYKGEVNGQWNDDSTEALKRFQADRQLESEGKINALTLRDLGLGPKHDGSSAPLSGVPAPGAPSGRAGEAPVEPPPMPTEPPPDSATPPE